MLRNAFACYQVCAVQTAFFLGCFFPPPTTTALVLMRPHRSCAGLAADGDKSFIVQSVIWHVKGSDVGPYLSAAPVGQRIELLDAMVIGGKAKIALAFRNGTSGYALVPSLTGNPGV